MRKIIKRLTFLSIIFLIFTLVACNKTGNENLDKKENTEVSQVKNNKDLGETVDKNGQCQQGKVENSTQSGELKPSENEEVFDPENNKIYYADLKDCKEEGVRYKTTPDGNTLEEFQVLIVKLIKDGPLEFKGNLLNYEIKVDGKTYVGDLKLKNTVEKDDKDNNRGVGAYYTGTLKLDA